MSRRATRVQILGQLEDWYRDLQMKHGLPPLSRLWGLAEHHRSRILGRTPPGHELLGSAVGVLLYSARKFDDRPPPREGLCRQTTENRFTSFFGRKLAWELKDHRRRLRVGKLPP